VVDPALISKYFWPRARIPPGGCLVTSLQKKRPGVRSSMSWRRSTSVSGKNGKLTTRAGRRMKRSTDRSSGITRNYPEGGAHNIIQNRNQFNDCLESFFHWARG